MNNRFYVHRSFKVTMKACQTLLLRTNMMSSAMIMTQVRKREYLPGQIDASGGETNSWVG